MAFTEQAKEFDEKVIAIDRVTRVVKGGRRFRFRATVVVGDGRGRVGLGIGKGSEVMTSIAKAVSKAKRNLVVVPLRETTIPHDIEVTFSGAHVLLRPAAAGTGVIAGGAVRNVVEAAGIRDLLTKSLGSGSKVNNAYATIMALSQLRDLPVRKIRSEERVVSSEGQKDITAPKSKTSTPDSTPPPAKQKPAAKKTAAKPKAKAKTGDKK
jgi:small subunit ribosomal protein S5